MEIDIFSEGVPVSLEAVLANKEWRVRRLAAFSETIVSVKLNIPGTIKNNHYFQAIFEVGWQELMVGSVSADNILSRLTGPEGFLTFAGSAETVKRRMVAFEETHPLGRLFDCDVAGLSRTQFGFLARRCFVCEHSAKACARSGHHTAEEIKAAINKIYGDYFFE